ncbi:TTL-domain-containing protein [Sporormia fimetaria CBS 119925]|uniref:TTL-domain-containing protein n=1 Tax=Sporormia fimetaria CBS 119925 TaxID=1340428 RepID=A0A6A6V6G6_9PLEO|nr:TTL-domain-containing protein [Sporormia fimetaria CBS 119925]
MAQENHSSGEANKIYALINYEDEYVQPLILRALEKRLAATSYELIQSADQLPSSNSRFLQWLQYEELDFQHCMSHSTTSLSNAYIIRKALIRKHYLSTTVANWITKHPVSVLKTHVKPSVEFEVDYAEFLDDALIEAYELKESWEKGEGKQAEEREWWILKPGMSERGQGIRLFSSEEELTEIFEEWDPDSDDEEEDEEDAERSDDESGDKGGNGIVTSHLRHFIAQPYIHPPLLLTPPGAEPDSGPRKFHIRTYVLAVGALKVYVYDDMLALFAARPYTPPWSSPSDAENLKAHLTNTCLQGSNDREGSVSTLKQLSQLPHTRNMSPGWVDRVKQQIFDITGAVFEAAARGMSIHFQALPNSFELFGLDFMIEDNEELTTYLLEVNAFPDFRQTGEDAKGVVEGLMEGVVDVAIKPFFGLQADESEETDGAKGLVKVLDIDLAFSGSVLTTTPTFWKPPPPTLENLGPPARLGGTSPGTLRKRPGPGFLSRSGSFRANHEVRISSVEPHHTPANHLSALPVHRRPLAEPANVIPYQTFALPPPPTATMGDQPPITPSADSDMVDLAEVDPSPVDETPVDVKETYFTSQPSPRSSSPGTSGLGLGNHGPAYYLTRLQKYSTYTFTLFTAMHLTNTSLIPLLTRSVPESNRYLLLTRPYYQSLLAEPLLVAIPLVTHVASGVALRFYRRRQALKRYGAEEREDRRSIPWPRFSGTTR